MILGLGLLAYVIVRQGWSRLHAQLQSEIAYEDERSLARDPGAVRALQSAGDPAWVERRALEASAGLAAPLPAGHLIQTADPPRLIAVAPAGENRYIATVERTYQTPSGLVVAVRLDQRYHSPEPGLWERLPPEPGLDSVGRPSPLQLTFQRLAVTAAVSDLGWLAAALPHIDDALARACLAWECPPDLVLPLLILDEWTGVEPPARVADLAYPSGGPYPLIFNLPRDPGGRIALTEPIRLLSPRLAGSPVDLASAEALAQGLTVRLLAETLSRLTRKLRVSNDYFFDALVARAEVRLGLSLEPPRGAIAPYDYLAPDDLWRLREYHSGEFAPLDLSARRQAYALLDFLLQNDAPGLEVVLLSRRNQGTSQTFIAWVETILTGESYDVLAQYRQRIAAASASAAAGAPESLDGLALACPGELRLWQPSGWERWPVTGLSGQWIGAYQSADGRFIAAYNPGAQAITILDRQAHTTRRFEAERTVLGWTSAGQMLYLAFPAETPTPPGAPVTLHGYDPLTGEDVALLDRPIYLEWVGSLRTQGARALGIAVVEPAPQPRVLPALVWLDETPPRLQVFDRPGFWPALSPDGRTLAVYTGVDPLTLNVNRFSPFPHQQLELWDANTGRLLRTVTQLDLPGFQGAAYLHRPLWSADGRWVILGARDLLGGTWLYALDPSTGQVWPLPVEGAPNESGTPLGLTADGRYVLTLRSFFGAAPVSIWSTVDLSRLPLVTNRSYFAQSLYPAPTGHWLAATSPLGAYLVDPATGAYHWLTSEPCSPGWLTQPR